MKKPIYQTKTISKDKLCSALGGMPTALMIWEQSIVPFLLYSSENWISLKKESIDMLEDLQFCFLRAVFSMSHSCPLPILLFETKTLSMELRVAKNKLLFAHHLEHLPKESLGHEVWKTLEELNIPVRLHRESQDLMTKLNLPSMKNQNKFQWKKLVLSRNFINNNNMFHEAIISFENFHFSWLDNQFDIWAISVNCKSNSFLEDVENKEFHQS